MNYRHLQQWRFQTTTLPDVGLIVKAPFASASVVVTVVTAPPDTTSPSTISLVAFSRSAVTTAVASPVPVVCATSVASASFATAPAVPLPSAATVAAVSVRA